MFTVSDYLRKLVFFDTFAYASERWRTRQHILVKYNEEIPYCSSVVG